MRPQILLSTPPGRGENYFAAFEAHGFEAHGCYLADDGGYDALVLCGGGDIDPDYFGQRSKGASPPDRDRDKAEFALFEKYRAAGKPIFGICRGEQLINVALGGTLIQHLETADTHRADCGDVCHEVQNLDGTCAAELFGKKMCVNSAHHQGCGELGTGVSVMQYHADGTVEGIFSDGIVAVQWHPERMTGKFANGIYSDPAPLFEYFAKMILKM